MVLERKRVPALLFVFGVEELAPKLAVLLGRALDQLLRGVGVSRQVKLQRVVWIGMVEGVELQMTPGFGTHELLVVIAIVLLECVLGVVAVDASDAVLVETGALATYPGKRKPLWRQIEGNWLVWHYFNAVSLVVG